MRTGVSDTYVEVSPFVDGGLRVSESAASCDVINPSNGRRIFSLPVGNEDDVNRAVAAARNSFEEGRWKDAPLSFRKRTLYKLADLIESEASSLDVLDAEEMGKPVSTPAFTASAAADLIRFNAEAIDKINGDAYGSDRKSFIVQRRVPRGVVAAIVPWNFPTFNAALKVAPALAAGNSVVLKPSELSSRTALRLACLAQTAGLPDGVLNVVPGLGETVGQALGLHPDVDMIAFTGSTDVGKKMLQYSGQSNMKVVMAECGGKSPQIVFPDGVDLDAASEAIAGFLVLNQGQICSVGSRLLVHRSIEAELTQKISAHVQRVVMGEALNSATTFGPLVSERQCERVMGYLKAARDDGAELVVGGSRVLRESGGYFVEPTIFRNVSPRARIAQEEIFGPVLSVIPFDTEEQAIQIANDTVYGLSAYVWTADLSRGMRMAKAIRSMTLINAAAPSGEGAGHAISWEPVGLSGMGTESGMAGMESYLRRHLVWFNHA